MKRVSDWFRRRHRKTALWVALVAVVTSVLMSSMSAYAATVSKVGFADVPADTVNIDTSLLDRSHATISYGSTGCKLATNKSITTSDYKWDVIYKPGSVAAGTKLSGTITIRWNNVGTDSSGSAIDVVMTLSNINFRDSGINPVILGWLSSGGGSPWAQSTNIDGGNTADVNMDITVHVYKHGTTTAASGTMLLAFTDIDVLRTDGRWSESVKLVSGVGGTVWMQADATPTISENSTRFTGAVSDDNASYKSGLVTTASTSGFKFSWWGSGCGTALLQAFRQNSQSVTASSGSGGSISSPGKSYLRWKNDKTYTITPNTGYHVSSVTVDGKSVGAVTSYTFKGVTSNHTIKAEFAPNAYTIKFNGNGSGVTGSTTAMSMSYDTAKNLTANGFSRLGYTFQGWNSKADGTGTTYSNQQSVKNLTAANNGTVTLYARWKENPPVQVSYQVSDPGHASVSTGSESLAPATGEAKGSTVTVNTGYRLVNWTDADNLVVGSGTSFTPSRGSDGLWHAGSYTANIEPIRYQIAFDANGGTGIMDNQPMTYDVADDLNANAFSRTGYLFRGWSTTRDGGVEFTDAQEVVNLVAEHDSTLTLYAVWEPISYTVVFEPGADEATGITESMTMTYDQWDTLSKNGFTYEGHTFNAWVRKDGRAYADEGKVRNLTTVDGDVVTLTARWTVKSNRVTFVDHDGSVLGSELVEWDGDAVAPEDPYHTGYTFTGWDRDYTHVKEPFTVTAQYRSHAYQIAFDANGGEGAMDDQPMTYDVADDLNANAFARDGYTFQGWATEPDGPIAYADGDTVLNLTAEDGGLVTLYAVWAEDAPVQVSYQVSDPEHASVSTGSESLAPATGEAKGSTVTLDKGYRLVGWTDSEGNEVGTDATYLPSRGADDLWHPETYTAQIAPVSYEIAFDANGGEGEMDNQPMTYDVAALLSANAFTRTGYHFTGWATEQGGEVVYEDMEEVVNLTAEDGGLVTLYAVWAEDAPVDITYQVSDSEHGTLSSEGESIPPVTGEAVGSTVTTGEGYRLVAWLDESGNEVGHDATYLPSRGESGLWREGTYTAQIAPVSYEIAFDANGGEGEMDNQPMTYDVAALLSANAFTRTGYHFTGWATEQGGEVVYEDMEEVVNLTAEDGGLVTLYAVWAEDAPVDITYAVSAPGHGSLSTESESLAPATGEAVGSTVTTGEGYRFVGWTDSEGNEVGTDATYLPSRGENGLWEPETYTAQLVPVGYEVAFDANGGEGEMDNQPMTYDVASALTKSAFSRVGYTFEGWATEQGGEVVYEDMEEVVNLTAEDGGLVTLYAVWKPQVLTVTFVTPDGTILDEQHVPYGEDATAPEDPTLRGHEFIGWDKDFTDVTEDLTVVALFEGVPVTTVGTYGKTGGSDAGVKTAVAALVLVAGGAAAYGVLQLRKDRRETPHE